MGIVRTWLLIGASALLAAAPAGAEPFVYEFRGSAAGTLDDAPFPLQTFRVTLFGDTADVVPLAPEVLGVAGSAAEFALDVAGAGSISTPLWVAVNQTFGGISLGTAGADLFGFYDAAFATYDLASPIGPVVSNGTYEQPIAVATSAGSLVFTTVADGLVFEAPEPGAVGSAAGALAALVTTSRRGRSRRASSARRA